MFLYLTGGSLVGDASSIAYDALKTAVEHVLSKIKEGKKLSAEDILILYLGAIVGDLKEIRADMARLDSRIDETNKRIDDVVKSLSARIDETNKRIDETNKRIDELAKSLTAQIGELNKRIDETNKRIDAVQITLLEIQNLLIELVKTSQQ
jgi:uncharacterized coiled-coil DUF342 family protein